MAKRVAEDEQVAVKPPERAAPRLAPPMAMGRLVWLCVAAWAIPGLGHWLLERKWRALILFAAILLMFGFGLLMQGQYFSTGTASYLESLGYFGELCAGLVMPAARFFGYAGGDPFFVSSDFGTAFLVSAGMLNVLAILDAYDIAVGRKN